MAWQSDYDVTPTTMEEVDDEAGGPRNDSLQSTVCSDLTQVRCLMPMLAKRLEISVPCYGYISPPVILLTLITNSLICLVLLRRGMRTATNLLLVAMALSDMLTGLCPLPCFVYFYTLGANSDWVPFSWCAAYATLIDRLPTVFHTASIWLTVALAVHRYICVCKPQTAKTLCTVNNVLRTIVCIYIAACISQITRFFDTTFEAVTLPSLVDPNVTMLGCVSLHPPFVVDNIDLYFIAYYCFRVIFIHFAPCCILVVLNALLVLTIRQAQRRRRQLLAQNRKSESRRLAESNVTTMMLVAVVGVFLLVEFPLAILVIVLMVDNTLDLDLLDVRRRDFFEQLINLFILLSYPINFFIYCGMSQQFRETFCVLLAPGGCHQPARPTEALTTKAARCRPTEAVTETVAAAPMSPALTLGKTSTARDDQPTGAVHSYVVLQQNNGDEHSAAVQETANDSV